jgi:sigma-B regulation protein RsbU (phosphoserine phosphatase)
VSELRATGMPLGLLPDQDYEEQETVLAPGELLLFYSDGLTEAHDAQRTMFGGQRVQALLEQYPQSNAPLLAELWTAFNRFTGSVGEQEDDITLITVSRDAGRNSD